MRRQIIVMVSYTILAPMRKPTTSTSMAKRRNREPTAHSVENILPVPLREINEDDVLFYFNHPLASQQLKFGAKIIGML